MDSLDGKTYGVYKVYTETSSYLINLNRGMAKRIPGDGMGKAPEEELEIEVVMLRGDNAWFNLRAVHAAVGQIMHLDCEGLDNTSGYTWRRTTIVRKIEKIDGRKKV
jgi:hypothetical protein